MKQNNLTFQTKSHLLRVADDNCHDDAIDGDSFTEDDADKVLGANSRCLDSTSQYARTS